MDPPFFFFPEEDEEDEVSELVSDPFVVLLFLFFLDFFVPLSEPSVLSEL